MSKRHTHKSRATGGLRVLTEDEIWETAKEVWEALPSSKIASGYIQAYRIADKVIESKGSNSFLGVGGNIHTNIRKDFRDTDTGLARKDNLQISAPPRTRDT